MNTQIDALLAQVNAEREFDSDPNSLTKTRCAGLESTVSTTGNLSNEDKLETLWDARDFLIDDLCEEITYKDGENTAAINALQKTISALDAFIRELKGR